MINKIKKINPIEMEYAITYVDMPIAADENERPFFPMITIAADHESGKIVHHDMKQKMSNVYEVKSEFIELIQQLGGLLSTILTYYRIVIKCGHIIIDIVN